MSTFTGQVSTLQGVVRAINPETGEARVLEKGSPVFAGEVIETSAVGGVLINMQNGTQLSLGRDTQMLIDGDVADKASAVDAPTESAVDVAALQQAVLEGNFDALEATAAGEEGAPGSASDGGVTVERIGAQGEVTSGFDSTASAASTTTDVQRDSAVVATTPVNALVSISGAQTIIEGNQSTAYTVSVDQPAASVTSPIIVELSYSGVAVDGTDFTGVTQVTIPAGSNSITFNIDTIDDALAEGSEVFTITIGAITDTNFDSIAVNGAAGSVDSVITDEAESTADDIVFVKLSGNDSVDEATGATLDHTVTLVDENGATITPAAGTSITVNLVYTNDDTESADFGATKVTQVTIDDTGVASISNSVLDDFLAEGVESYTLGVASVVDNNSTYEKVEGTADTVTGTITDNDHIPTTLADSYTVVEGTNTILGSVLSNDSDLDGDSISAYLVSADNGVTSVLVDGVSTITTALGGTVLMNSDGSYTYTSPVRDHDDLDGTSDGLDMDSFVYKASDDANTSAWTTVTIDITDTNPIAHDDSNAVELGGSVSGNVITENDNINVDGPVLITQVVHEGIVYNNFDASGNLTITSSQGVAVINQDGSYKYTSSLHPSHGGTDGLADWENLSFTAFNGARTVEADNEFFIDAITHEPSNTNILTMTGTGTLTVKADVFDDGTDGIGIAEGAGNATYLNGHPTHPEALMFDLGAGVTSIDASFYSGTNSGVPFYWATYDSNGDIVGTGSGNISKPGFTLAVENTSSEPFQYVVFYGIDDNASSKILLTGVDNINYSDLGSEEFIYTIQDADGDVSDAILTIGTGLNTPAVIITDNNIPEADNVFTTSNQVTDVIPASLLTELNIASDSIAFFKVLDIGGGLDGDLTVKENDASDPADLGGNDLETTEESLIFDITSLPAYGTVYIEQNGVFSAINVNNLGADSTLLTTSDKVYWVATHNEVLVEDSVNTLGNVFSADGMEGSWNLEDGIEIIARNSLNQDAVITYVSTDGIGVNGVTGGPSNQLGYNAATGKSEAIIVDFAKPVTNAEISITHLMKSEGEVGKVVAFLDGKEVGSYTFSNVIGVANITLTAENIGGNAGGSNSGVFQIDNLVFDQLRFSGEPYVNQNGVSSDSSDYFIGGITYHEVSGVEFQYKVTDEAGNDSEVATVKIDLAPDTQIPDNASGDNFLHGSDEDDVFIIDNDTHNSSTTHIYDFNEDHDTLDLSEVIDTNDQVDLSKYLQFTLVDSDGDHVEDDTMITIDSNGKDTPGGDSTTVYIQDKEFDNISDLTIDYQND